MQKRFFKKVVAKNRRATFDYKILETYLAGIVLTGSEVKSAKKGQVNLRDSFIRVQKGEVWLINAHISLWRYSRTKDYDPKTQRKLLLKRKEIRELQILQDSKNMSIIPLKMFVQRGKLKLKIGVGKGRKKYDKRLRVKEREIKRQIGEELAKVKRF